MPLKIFSELTHLVSHAALPAASDALDRLGEEIKESRAKIIRGFGHGVDAEDLNDFTHEGGVEVTIYPTYGFEREGRWVIPLRGRVRQKRRLPDEAVARLVAKTIECGHPDLHNIISRSRDFTDDSRSAQTVVIEFDADPGGERYAFPKSDLNGLVEREIELPGDAARRLLDSQGETAWLSFKVVSEGHAGRGRVRLLEAEGLSVVSDIDDTVKVTLVPGDKDEVLRKTFCQDYQAAPGMSEKYNREWGEAAFHYVSGGPWQLYGPLSDFLIRGAGHFPEGSFHLTYHPKNFLAEDSREILIESVVGSLGNTFAHKVNEIGRLMSRLPGREFILVGDSGEVDPEVYRHITTEFPGRVREVWIRDVLNDAEVNAYRLEGMSTIKVEPPLRATTHHYQKLAMRLQELYNRPYVRDASSAPG
jgi:hypothetical protein